MPVNGASGDLERGSGVEMFLLSRVSSSVV